MIAWVILFYSWNLILVFKFDVLPCFFCACVLLSLPFCHLYPCNTFECNDYWSYLFALLGSNGCVPLTPFSSLLACPQETTEPCMSVRYWPWSLFLSVVYVSWSSLACLCSVLQRVVSLQHLAYVHAYHWDGRGHVIGHLLAVCDLISSITCI